MVTVKFVTEVGWYLYSIDKACLPEIGQKVTLIDVDEEEKEFVVTDKIFHYTRDSHILSTQIEIVLKPLSKHNLE